MVKSNEIGGGDTAAEVKRVVLEMLKVGNTITVCGRAFSVYACDGFTRQFYEEGEEMSMPPNETNEHESTSSRDSKDDFESGVNNSLAFKRAKGPPNARLDDMARFTEAKLQATELGVGSGHQKEISRTRRGGFTVLRHMERRERREEDATDDEKRMFCVHYFLADDTVEVIEKGGRALLRRGKLPKISSTSEERRKQKENRRYRHQHHLRNR